MSATMEVKPKLEKKPVKFSNLLREYKAVEEVDAPETDMGANG